MGIWVVLREGYFECCHLWTFCIHLFPMPVLISIGYIPRGGVAGSQGPCEFLPLMLSSGSLKWLYPCKAPLLPVGQDSSSCSISFFILDVVRVYYFSPYGVFWPWGILFCKMPVHISCLLLLIGLSVFFLIDLYKLFIYSGCKPFVGFRWYKYLLSCYGLFFFFSLSLWCFLMRKMLYEFLSLHPISLTYFKEASRKMLLPALLQQNAEISVGLFWLQPTKTCEFFILNCFKTEPLPLNFASGLC